MTIQFNADEVFEMGMDIEKNGEAFYRRAAELSKDERIKAVFTDLMEQEQQHYETSMRSSSPVCLMTSTRRRLWLRR